MSRAGAKGARPELPMPEHTSFFSYLIAMFPAVNGYFFLPNYGTIIAAINFDRTGTTGIGRFVLNHSFMLPGFIATVVAVGTGLVIASIW